MVFAKSIEFSEQFNEFLLCAWHCAKYHGREKDPDKCWLQGVWSLIRNIDIYANNHSTGTYPFLPPDL
jgi:hypothetical protein